MTSSFSRLAAKPQYTVFASALAFALLFAAAASLFPPRVRVSMAFTIAQQARQETTEYSYDGYYALRASELVADTLLSWLSTPAVMKEVFAQADVAKTDAEIDAAAGRFFRAKKFSGQNVVVTFSAPDADMAERLSRALAAVLPERARGLVRSPKQDSLFLVSASAPVLARTEVAPKRAALAGAFVGAFLGLALAYHASRKTA